MRIVAAVLILTLATGCASGPGPQRETEYQRLARDCAERGGIFVAMPGPSTGRPETDNACQFNGPPARR